MFTMKLCLSKYYLSLFQNSSSGTSANPCFPLRRAYLFTLMQSHYPLIKSTNWRTPLSFVCIVINWYWVWLWLDLYCHELQCLVGPWYSWMLCIYVLRSQKGLARYHYCHIISWLVWQHVAVWDTLLLLASWLCHWYESL